MDEISRLGDIRSINDLFDFKISIKTIIFLLFFWGAGFIIVIVFMLGGVNNTFQHGVNLIDSVKSTVLETRNKNIAKKPNTSTENTNATTDKTSNKNSND